MRLESGMDTIPLLVRVIEDIVRLKEKLQSLLSMLSSGGGTSIGGAGLVTAEQRYQDTYGMSDDDEPTYGGRTIAQIRADEARGITGTRFM